MSNTWVAARSEAQSTQLIARNRVDKVFVRVSRNRCSALEVSAEGVSLTIIQTLLELTVTQVSYLHIVIFIVTRYFNHLLCINVTILM